MASPPRIAAAMAICVQSGTLKPPSESAPGRTSRTIAKTEKMPVQKVSAAIAITRATSSGDMPAAP